MAELRMTPARLELLKAVAAERVFTYRPQWRGMTVNHYLAASHPDGLARQITNRVMDLVMAGLVVRSRVGGPVNRERTFLFVLTDAGREVLARYTQDGEGK